MNCAPIWENYAVSTNNETLDSILESGHCGL